MILRYFDGREESTQLVHACHGKEVHTAHTSF